MCGITGALGGTSIKEGLEAIKHRGVDYSNTIKINNVQLGHNRLSIVDLTEKSNQPYIFNELTMVYNGEIWNTEYLADLLCQNNIVADKNSDTDIIAKCLFKWGTKAFDIIDGMFAVAWTTDGETLYIARDKYGEIPIYYTNTLPLYFCSEIKGLKKLNVNLNTIQEVPAGCILKASLSNMEVIRYYDIDINPVSTCKKEAASNIFKYLKQGVEERIIADVPVCTLISGGIDSAIIAYFLKQHIKNLSAYIAVYDEKSKDLQCARKLCKDLNISLMEVKIPLPTQEDLKEIIDIVEMPYKAQIEIAWACHILAKQIHKDGYRVVYSGEGSDELWGSYGFAYHGIQKKGWYEYKKELFQQQSRKNFIRCNKIFMKHSIECRLPFLNKDLVEYCLSLPQDIVQETKSKPKAILQQAFSEILPDTIVKRSKMAFQDGLKIKTPIQQVLNQDKSFYNRYYKEIYGVKI